MLGVVQMVEWRLFVSSCTHSAEFFEYLTNGFYTRCSPDFYNITGRRPTTYRGTHVPLLWRRRRLLRRLLLLLLLLLRRRLLLRLLLRRTDD
jgi:hypothetical protein